MEYDTLAALFAVAICAGIVDGIAGGGGLLTLPALLLAGLPPAQALATNKIQALSSVSSSAFRFVRAGYIRPRDIAGKVAISLIGAGGGAYALRIADPVMLGRLAPILLMGVAVFFLFSRRWIHPSRQALVGENLFLLLAVLPISFYDGFFGPGTGAIYVAAFMVLLARAMPQATAETKVLNATGSLMAAAVFIQGATIAWLPALVMAAGGMIGGYAGASLAIRWGADFIRVVLVVVSVVLALRLLLQQAGFGF